MTEVHITVENAPDSFDSGPVRRRFRVPTYSMAADMDPTELHKWLQRLGDAKLKHDGRSVGTELKYGLAVEGGG